jgi:NAD+ kinase
MSNHFKTIGIIGKHGDPHAGGVLRELLAYLDRCEFASLLDEVSLGVATNLAERNAYVSRETLGKDCDLVIVVGGDGTMLNAARSLVDFDVPLLGINLGRLGFLTDITPTTLIDSLDQIFAGNYQEEKRDLLQARVLRNGKQINESAAFNDVVVHTCNVARMIEYDLHIGGKHVNTARSDGMIVSTPTGSTAYALSGGGPILHPSLSALVLVPICPHTMSYRPIVVDANNTIEIIVSENNQARAQCTCDGQIDLGLENGDHVMIKQKEKPIRLIHPSDYNYYGILRAKLHWGKRL